MVPAARQSRFLIGLYNRWHPIGLEIVGLDYERDAKSESEAREMAKKFVEAIKIPYPSLLGDEETVKQIPGFKGFPTTVIVDRAGKARLFITENDQKTPELIEDAVRVLLAEPAPKAGRKVPAAKEPAAKKPVRQTMQGRARPKAAANDMVVSLSLTALIEVQRRGGGHLELAGGRAEPDSHFPELVRLVLGQQIFHDDLVGRGHARVLKDHAEPGQRPAGLGVPDFDQAVRPARNAVILVAVQDGQAIKLAKLVELLGLDHVPDQLGGDQLGHPFLIVRGVKPHRLILLGRHRAGSSLRSPERSPTIPAVRSRSLAPDWR